MKKQLLIALLAGLLWNLTPCHLAAAAQPAGRVSQIVTSGTLERLLADRQNIMQKINAQLEQIRSSEPIIPTATLIGSTNVHLRNDGIPTAAIAGRYNQPYIRINPETYLPETLDNSNYRAMSEEQIKKLYVDKPTIANLIEQLTALTSQIEPLQKEIQSTPATPALDLAPPAIDEKNHEAAQEIIQAAIANANQALAKEVEGRVRVAANNTLLLFSGDISEDKDQKPIKLHKSANLTDMQRNFGSSNEAMFFAIVSIWATLQSTLEPHLTVLQRQQKFCITDCKGKDHWIYLWPGATVKDLKEEALLQGIPGAGTPEQLMLQRKNGLADLEDYNNPTGIVFPNSTAGLSNYRNACNTKEIYFKQIAEHAHLQINPVPPRNATLNVIPTRTAKPSPAPSSQPTIALSPLLTKVAVLCGAWITWKCYTRFKSWRTAGKLAKSLGPLVKVK